MTENRGLKKEAMRTVAEGYCSGWCWRFCFGLLWLGFCGERDGTENGRDRKGSRMASIAEILTSKNTESFNWEWIEGQLQKESARTYFPVIKMAPAKVCLNAWASYRICETVSLDDVLCSPVMAAVGSEELIPDPSRPKPKQRPDIIRDRANRTYQADPTKYEKRPEPSEAVILCKAIVDMVIADCDAPDWFLHWMDWRYPETGRYSTDHKEEGRELCYIWAKDAGAKMICGGFVTDTYALRSVASLVQKMDVEFMRCLRSRFATKMQ